MSCVHLPPVLWRLKRGARSGRNFSTWMDSVGAEFMFRPRSGMEQNDAYNKRVGVGIDEGVVEIEYHKPIHESGSANGLGGTTRLLQSNGGWRSFSKHVEFERENCSHGGPIARISGMPALLKLFEKKWKK